MFLSKLHEQMMIEILQRDYIAITADSLLIDRQPKAMQTPQINTQRILPRNFDEYILCNSKA
jgi:hypothetical protein